MIQNMMTFSPVPSKKVIIFPFSSLSLMSVPLSAKRKQSGCGYLEHRQRIKKRSSKQARRKKEMVLRMEKERKRDEKKDEGNKKVRFAAAFELVKGNETPNTLLLLSFPCNVMHVCIIHALR
jgi:hypothetical protein